MTAKEREKLSEIATKLRMWQLEDGMFGQCWDDASYAISELCSITGVDDDVVKKLCNDKGIQLADI